MPRTKTEVMVRVLYPQAFAAIGVDAEGKDKVRVDPDKADWLLATGYGELVEEAEPKKADK